MQIDAVCISLSIQPEAPRIGKLLLIYICNSHVLNHLLLIYICKLHWNQKMFYANFALRLALNKVIPAVISKPAFFLIQNEKIKYSEVLQAGKLLLIYICNFHVLSHLLLIYICELHWNLNTMFVCQVNSF